MVARSDARPWRWDQRSVSRRGDVTELPVIDVLFLGVTLGWGPKQPVVPSRRSEQPEVRE